MLWEISASHAPTATDLTNATWGFTNNLGYTMAQPSIVRLESGAWVVILANGYGSTNNKAILYIIDINDGHVIQALNTGVGDSTNPNGLSTPIAVDTDGNRSANYVYAGDLSGNLWKFDLQGGSGSWKVAFNGSPLFKACDNSPSCVAQAITSKPQVGSGPNYEGYMVYFGTGKYFEKDPNPSDADSYDPDDNKNLQVQTFYGIWDKEDATVGRDQLQVQTIDEEITLDNGFGIRRSSRNTVDYGNGKRGWYMDLLKPGSPPVQEGERVVNFPDLVGGRIIFTTLIPSPPAVNDDPCGTGSSGTGWLVELDALYGQPLPVNGPAPLDVNKDKKIDDADKSIGGQNLSGLKSNVGIPTRPARVNVTTGIDGDGTQCTEEKYIVGSLGVIENHRESCTANNGPPSGRQAWRQAR